MQNEPTLASKIRELLLSKKFLTYLIGMVATVLTAFNIEISDEQVQQLVQIILTIAGMSGMTVSYLLAQGLSDFGKEAAKEESKFAENQLYGEVQRLQGQVALLKQTEESLRSHV